ncbi:MAG: hypothetical protein KAJ95_01400 [Gammaproteobacteria bacterium]|nr:hypothetical protein [Gammaproteobacteria bacterium]
MPNSQPPVRERPLTGKLSSSKDSAPRHEPDIRPRYQKDIFDNHGDENIERPIITTEGRDSGSTGH